jgi:hypothetical protein
MTNDLEYHRDIVLFLGAGFSLKAGLPLMGSFGDPDSHGIRNLPMHASSPRDSEGFRYSAPKLVEAKEAFEYFQKYCLSGNTSPSESLNLEKLCSIAEALIESGLDHISLFDRPYSLQHLLRQLQWWIWKVYHQCPLVNPFVKKYNENVLPELYDSFFMKLRNFNLIDRLTVVTTNYDLVFEYMAYKHNFPVEYPLMDYELINVCDNSDRFVYIQKDPFESERPLMCKLHGSVNYFYKDDISLLDELYVTCDLGDDQPIGKSKIWKDRPSIVALDAIWVLHNKYGANLYPAITLPTYAKFSKQPWIRNVWKHAFHSISEAKAIVFIGFGMNPSDGFMPAMIKGALSERSSETKPVFHVIDPCESVHKRYEEYFHPLYTFEKSDCISLENAIDGHIDNIFSKL